MSNSKIHMAQSAEKLVKYCNYTYESKYYVFRPVAREGHES